LSHGSGGGDQPSSSLFRELRPAKRAAAAEAAREAVVAEPTLRERLRATAPNRRWAALLEHVRLLTVKVLGIQPTDTFDVREPLRQLGLDSLMAVELRNLLAKTAERSMPSTITFDYPSVKALTDYLAAEAFRDELQPAAVPTSSGAPPVSADAVEMNEDFSAEELASRLSEKLDRIAYGELQ
jgi:acyl carrier protein